MSAVEERAAQMMAHRACCGVEHDPQAGKFHGCCVVCGVPWPCEYVGPKPSHAERLDTLQKEFQQCVEQRDALEAELAGWKLFADELVSFDPNNEDEIKDAATEIARRFHEMKAENEQLRKAFDASVVAAGALAEQSDKQAFADLLAENERLRMQLTACGVVAMANTPETAAKARNMHAEYKSASCADVARAVDREMTLRAELDSTMRLLDAEQRHSESMRNKVSAAEAELATAKNDALALTNAVDELLEVAALRGDDELPHPSNDPILWTARMQEAWDNLKQLRALKREGDGNG